MLPVSRVCEEIEFFGDFKRDETRVSVILIVDRYGNIKTKTYA